MTSIDRPLASLTLDELGQIQAQLEDEIAQLGMYAEYSDDPFVGDDISEISAELESVVAELESRKDGPLGENVMRIRLQALRQVIREELHREMKLSVARKGKDEPKRDEGCDESEEIDEVSPPGWEGTTKAMKKHGEIDNPFALAWSMKKRGAKPHHNSKKPYGKKRGEG